MKKTGTTTLPRINKRAKFSLEWLRCNLNCKRYGQRYMTVIRETRDGKYVVRLDGRKGVNTYAKKFIFFLDEEN